MRTYSLYDVYARNSSLFAEDTALVENDKRISFRTLHSDVVRTAGKLRDKGVQSGDRVAVLTMNRTGFLVLLGALAKLGAIMVPLNWRLSLGELHYILKDSSSSLLFSDETHAETAGDLSTTLGIEMFDLQTWLDDGAGDENEKRILVGCNSEITSETPVVIIYTAAVEGRPRGAVLSHGNLIAANMQVIVSMGLGGNDVNLNMLPLFHITGLNLALATMQVGGTNVIIEKFDENQTLALTKEERVTIWGSFPPILSRVMEAMDAGGHDVSTLKYVVGLDGPDGIASLEEKTDAKFWILYGQSETSGFVTFSEASEKPGTAGRQGCITSFGLVDEDDQFLDPGEIGEIVVRGPLVFQGYWNLDKVNEKTFRSGWHHTGDLGMVDEDGYLHYKGRKPEKELIKPGGENVYPAEVEAVILEHEAVEAVSVIGVPDPQFGEGIKAICVLKEGKQLDKEGLIGFVGSQIARYKKPRYVEFVHSLPMKEGEIDRDRVKELWGK